MIAKLIYRNINLYFRDKTSVFFSLLSVLMVVLLYVLFLSNVQVQSVSEQIGKAVKAENISYLINSWILAGMLSITTVTSTLGALGFIVSDRENKIIMDFKSSPLPVSAYPIAAIISAVLVGVIMSLLTLVVYGLYIFINTGYYFSLLIIFKTVVLIFISAIMNAALMGFIVSFFSSNNAFSTASLLIGTSIGFVNGLYIAIGQLPNLLQNVLKFLPFSHIAALFRQALMKESIDLSFSNAPLTVSENYKQTFGVVLNWKDAAISLNTSITFILIVFIISLILFFANFSRKREVI